MSKPMGQDVECPVCLEQGWESASVGLVNEHTKVVWCPVGHITVEVKGVVVLSSIVMLEELVY